MGKKEISSGEKWIAKISMVIILIMGSLIVYLVVNYEEIRKEQYYKALQHLNAK